MSVCAVPENMHSPHSFENFIMINEQTGSLWSIPKKSLVAELSQPIYITQDRFKKKFADSTKDSNAFLTAEIVDELSGKNDVNLPTHVFKSCVLGRVIYTKAVTVESGLNQGKYAKQFHLAVSFEEHFKLHNSSSDNSIQSIVGLGQIVTPELDSTLNRHVQRPPPSSIKDARLVADVATELDAMQRELYVTACCAPYLFRDCFSNIKVYWNSTQRHKEHHPSRLALKNRLRREEEQRQIHNVQTLLKRSKDPQMAKILVRNATSGIRVLSDLMQNGPTVHPVQLKLPKSRQFTSFFGEEGLPLDLQKHIGDSFMHSILSTCDSNSSWTLFQNMRLVSKQFNTLATSATNLSISVARDEILEFVRHGTLKSSLNFTYQQFACSPTTLLCLKDSNTHSVWQAYFNARLNCALLNSVCMQRACVKTNVILPKSERLLSLHRIVNIIK